MNRNFSHCRLRQPRQRGSVTLEYIIITVVAGVISMAAVSYLATLVHEKLTQLGTQLESDATPEEWDGLFD